MNFKTISSLVCAYHRNLSTDGERKTSITFSLSSFSFQCICHVFRICYACLDLKERLNLHFQAKRMIYHVYGCSIEKLSHCCSYCQWDVISDADVFHTRPVCRLLCIHCVCVCVFCSSSSLDNFYF